MRENMRHDLKTAMKARDQTAVAALRSALAAIDNAEAVQIDHAAMEHGSGGVAGSAVGLGAAEAERRELAAADIQAIMETEVNDRIAAANEYEQAGRRDAGGKLRAEADVLRGYLPVEQ
ncbi:MAG TPA: GatB/YqeY domain-containing protein [Arthrobacter sp.]|nr:GatB/YqeY domain-containing protein [Arthrobacter sp.]